MMQATSEHKISYYKEGMRMLFSDGETFENYQNVLEEYKQALVTRKIMVDQLYDEIIV